jgi:hypothetical protein
MNKNKHKIIGIFLTLVMAFGFAGQAFAATPSVTTDSASSITISSATLNGDITSDGGFGVTARGFEYGLDTNYGSSVDEAGSLSLAYSSQFGSNGSGNGEFNGPYGIAIDSSDNVYVVDGNNNRVQKFNSSGVYISQFGSGGSGNGQFNTPRGIAIDPSGNIFVVDTYNSRIQKFNSSGVYQAQYTGFSYPVGIAIDSQGNMYVGDQGNSRVRKLDSSGNVLGNLATNGSGDGQVSLPYNATIDPSDNVYVFDTYNHRIQKFDSSGTFQFKFGTQGSGNGQFGDYNSGIDIDSQGNIYASDHTNNRFQKFDSFGVYISQLGSGGSGNGEFNGVAGLAVNSNDIIYVADTNNHRVQKFSVNPLPTGAYSGNISGLTCGTTYHYRAYATNQSGTNYGSDATFTTSACVAPTVSITNATYVSATSTKLIANITDTGGLNATVRGFEYGLDTNYGTNVPEAGNFGTGAFLTTITGLTEGTTYHYRAYATNGAGTTYTSDATFVAGYMTPISSCTEFEDIADDTTTLDGVYILTKDLDCRGRGNNIMVGTSDPFTGVFDGDGYTITVNINSSGNSNIGLFAQASAPVISNLNIAGSVLGGSSTGALIGNLINSSSNGDHPLTTISNVHSTVNVNSNSTAVGGLIGYIDNEGSSEDGDTTAVNITNSSSSGLVASTIGDQVGGLVGSIYQDYTANINITDSYATGNVTGSGNVGGLIGYFEQYDGNVTITGNHYSGRARTQSSNSNTGGLIGYLLAQPSEGYDDSTVNISNNFTAGFVTSIDGGIGGLIGYLDIENYQSYPMTIDIEGNYSTSTVSGADSNNAGLIGQIYLYNDDTNYSVTFNFEQNYYEGTINTNNTNVGGLIGYINIDNDNINGTLAKNYFSGVISGGGSANNVGGLVGRYNDNDYSTWVISDSYAAIDITSYARIGGLIGYDESGLEIIRSYAKGTITSSNPSYTYTAGGLIGRNNGDNQTITDSFVSVVTSGFTSENSVISDQQGTTTFSNTFYDQTVSGGECTPGGDVTGCTPVNTTGSPDATYFQSNHLNAPLDNWNFTNIWTNITGLNNDFPVFPNTTAGLSILSATSITDTTATLNANLVSTGGENIVVRGFNYGLTTSYGTTTTETGSFGIGAFSADIIGLSACTTYHYRAYTKNTNDVYSYSGDKTFNTCGGVVVTLDADTVSSTSIKLNGNIANLNGSNATVRGFNYGLTTSYGTTITESGSFSVGQYFSTVNSLVPDTTYHYRAYATNSTGTVYGDDETFIINSMTTISSCAEFEAIDTDTNTLDGKYLLANDLDCSSRNENIMIGESNPFTGIFDGGGHTITINMHDVNTSYLALFSQTDGATISNLNIAGSVIGKDYAGSLIGNLNNSNGGQVSTISNVHSTAIVIGTQYLGGLIGYIDNQGNGEYFDTTAVNIINSSHTTGLVGGTNYVGGLIGYVYQDYTASTNIINSYALGTVTADDGYVGGLVGEFDIYDGNTKVTGNYFTGTVDGDSDNTGGLIGYMYIDPSQNFADSNINISNNHSSGTVSGAGSVGGFIGYFDIENSQQYSLIVTIEDNYSNANVNSSDEYIGGLVGYMYLNNSYVNYPITFNFNQNYAENTVTATANGLGYTGGLIGNTYSDSDGINATFSKNYFSGTITTDSGNRVGGLIGYHYDDGDTPWVVSDSYAVANITADNKIGGILGEGDTSSGLTIERVYANGTITGSDSQSSESAGGLVGVGTANETITDSFASVALTNLSSNYGAFIGIKNDTTFTNNFFDQNLNLGLDCTGAGTATGCTPVDTVSGVYFKSNSVNAPLSNWNFNTIWRNQTNVNNNYPILQQFNPISTPTVVTSNAQLVRGTTATLYGNVSSTGTENNSLQGFNYGLNTSYGSTASVSGSFTDGAYSISISNLLCGTEYHYKAFSANSAGTGYGSDMTFNTTGCSVGGSGPGSRSSSSSSSSSSSVPSSSSNIKPIVNNNNSYVQINKFTKKLRYKDNNIDVKNLQKFLNTIGFTVSQKGAGSKGFETNYFGVATRKSVIAFQKAYKLQPDGVVGPNTLKVINSLAK